jgi:formate hydrogenlyase transcriptional activator
MGTNSAQKALITIGEDSAGRNHVSSIRTRSQTQPKRSLADRYEALCRVSQVIGEYRSPNELFCLLAAELHKVVEFDGVGVAQFDEAEGRIERSSQAGTLPPVEGGPGETITRWVYEHQEPLVIPFVDREAHFRTQMNQLKECGIQSVCAFPLTTVYRRIGSLVIGSENPDAYPQDEVCFLSLVANQAAVAIGDTLNWEASRLAQKELERKLDSLQHERDRLKLLLDVNNNVISNLELRDLLGSLRPSLVGGHAQGRRCSR